MEKKKTNPGEELTCPVGLVALRGQAGHAAAHLVDGDDAELVIHIRREAQHSRVDAPGVPGVVVPHSRLHPVLLKLDNVVWEDKGSVGSQKCAVVGFYVLENPAWDGRPWRR